MIALALAITALAAVLAWRWWPRARPPVPAPAEPAGAALAAERQRIYQDLHDDLGAKLLSLIHRAPDAATADLARSALQDLRDVVSRTRGEPGSLLDSLGEIEGEARQRLEASGGLLLWEQEDGIADPRLDHAQALQLYRIVREAISNALRHAQARHVRIRVRQRGATLYLDVTDDGPGLAVEGGRGQGLAGMRQRAGELGGAIDWTAGSVGGTKVVLQFPLPR
ncbi:ATP-binding protein [Stagnimonas aquatica]|uniref:histidine kinase n=1 Tax=Stagnimonas aquatica TaxID=2689987 RepID=A0A3N0VH64_9GAMM|nr:ATP-binding protein [Stagnimonas aquatica]ROH92034.1 ATP-binding protein [Stagnimonas aquatica]